MHESSELEVDKLLKQYKEFTVGEELTIKGHRFRVKSMGSRFMTLMKLPPFKEASDA